MNKTTEALKLAKKALDRSCGAITVLASMEIETAQKLLEENDKAIAAIREALAQEEKLPDNCEWIDGEAPPEGERMRIQASGEAWFVKNGRYYRVIAKELAEPVKQEPKCSDHPDAPHGFDRNASHNAGRYVCNCEGWEPDDPVKQKPIGYVVGDDDDYEGSIIYANKNGDDMLPVYLEPVDAKAIRAEALEEAAKVCDKAEYAFVNDTCWGHANGANNCAAAIRGLK